MNIFVIILIFISVFVSFVSWQRNNKIALILSISLTILIVIFSKQIGSLLNKHMILWGFSTINTVNKMITDANTSPFISSKWQDSSLVHSEPPIRIGMIKDFITHYKPYQKRKEEILNLLGKPDYSEELKEWDMVYWLGKESNLISTYTQWFVIEFDSSGKVSECEIFKY
jgi:hypothetical protein